MSENLKTIKEIADEIGVSKQAVWQKIKKESSIDLRQFTSKKGNTVYVDVDGKSLMVPLREDEKESVERKSNDIDKIKEEPHKKNKKWWHFGRM